MAVEFGSPKGPHHSPIIRVGAYEKDIRKEYEKQLLKWIITAPGITTGRPLQQAGSVLLRQTAKKPRLLDRVSLLGEFQGDLFSLL